MMVGLAFCLACGGGGGWQGSIPYLTLSVGRRYHRFPWLGGALCSCCDIYNSIATEKFKDGEEKRGMT
jgi:hypothetical protein